MSTGPTSRLRFVSLSLLPPDQCACVLIICGRPPDVSGRAGWTSIFFVRAPSRYRPTPSSGSSSCWTTGCSTATSASARQVRPPTASRLIIVEVLVSDPSAVELIVKFTLLVRGQAPAVEKPIDLENEEAAEVLPVEPQPKPSLKNLALRTLGLKAASHLKWNLGRSHEAGAAARGY